MTTSPDYTLIKSVTDTSNRFISSTPQNSKLRVAEVPFRRNTNELRQHIDVESLTKKIIAHTLSAIMGTLTRCGHTQFYVELVYGCTHAHSNIYMKLVT